MSTRATYEIDGATFYIHHDGYPEGAATYLAAMIAAAIVPDHAGAARGHVETEGHEDRRGGLVHAFIRANLRAEPVDGHDAMGGTEYRYTVTTYPAGRVCCYASARKVSWIDAMTPRETWAPIFTGPLVDFVDRFGSPLGAAPLCELAETYHAGTRYTTATRAAALEVAALLEGEAARFEGMANSNPNGPAYRKRAEAWRRAAERQRAPA